MLDDIGACDFCGDEFQMSSMFEIDGDHYCPACKEEHFTPEFYEDSDLGDANVPL